MTRAVSSLTDAERAAFVAAARSFVGVRWQHQGRTANGLDCAGLIIVAIRAIGKEPVDSIGYPRKPYRHMLEATMRRNLGDPLPGNTALQLGDMVLMQFGESDPSHVGIIGSYRDYLTLIHAHAPDKKVVEMRLDDVWRGKIVEVYR